MVIIDENKSATQKLGDSTRSGADDAQSQGKGVVQQISDAAGNAAQSVQETLQGKK